MNASSTLKKNHFISMWTLNIQLQKLRFTGMKSLFATVKLKERELEDSELEDSELSPRSSAAAVAAARCWRHVLFSSRRKMQFHHPAPSKGKRHIKNRGVDTDTACALNDLTDCDRADTERMNGSTIWGINTEAYISEGVMDSTQPTNHKRRFLHTMNDSPGPRVTHAQNCFMIVCLEAFSDCWTEPKKGFCTSTPEVQDSLDCGKQLITDSLEPN